MPDAIGNWLKGASIALVVIGMLVGGTLYIENSKATAASCIAENEKKLEAHDHEITTLKEWVRDNRELPSKVDRMTVILERIDRRMERFEEKIMEN